MEIRPWKAFLAGALCVLLLLSAGFVLLFGGWGGALSALRYGQALWLFRLNYVADYDPAEVADMAMVGAVAGLGDTWSYYMTAEEYDDYVNMAGNVYQGIGITVRKDEETGGFYIVSVAAGGPADTAGLVPGDVILAVDGEDVTGGELVDLRARILEQYGGTARVTLRRAGGVTEEVEVLCREVYTSPVSWEMLSDGVTGYVQIKNFREGAARDAIDAMTELMDAGAERLIFDVRNDLGGQLSELTSLLDVLLPAGEIFVSSDKDGRETVRVSDESCIALPMVVLVNDSSYSAAEFFAAALREYDWALLVGEATTGKSRSQVTYPLLDGSAIHISTARYLTPHRVDLTETGGLVPDVEVPLDEDLRALLDAGTLPADDDPQIAAALEALEAAG